MTEHDPQYKGNYIAALRQELLEVIEHKLSPIALKYHYADVGLESRIKWKPVILILGNYSSGKSTLINEFIGATIQKTGQAPTDDSFTVLTNLSQEDGLASEGVVKDGRSLVNDPRFPFMGLKKYGEKFTAHFCLKSVSAPILDDLAIIDTPGMLDSSSEINRGYDYQAVVGELAQLADLVVVMFDPHKAGTVRETHISLRETLPQRTFEDRLCFVLNRIDECTHLNDLLRVYGALCWNLSQMTGRKDIPTIYLSYSRQLSSQRQIADDMKEVLRQLGNQRDELFARLKAAPRYRLDHLATYLELHGERLILYLRALLVFKRKKLYGLLKYGFVATTLGLALALGVYLQAGDFNFGGISPAVTASVFGVGFWILAMIFWFTLLSRYHASRLIYQTEGYLRLRTQQEQDSWAAIKDRVFEELNEHKYAWFLWSGLAKDLRRIKKVYKASSRSARQALAELEGFRQ